LPGDFRCEVALPWRSVSGVQAFRADTLPFDLKDPPLRTNQKPRASIQDIRRAELIEAAKHCISEHGLAETTVRLIAEYAHTTPSSVVYHFDSKETLVIAAVAATADEMRQHVEREIIGVEGCLAKLEAIAWILLQPDSETTVAWRLWLDIRSQAARDSFVRSVYVEKYEAWLSFIRGVVQAGVDSGEIKETDVAALSTMVSATIDGVAFHLLIGQEPDRRRAIKWCITSLRSLVQKTGR
jgi:AcrR family transcriptional regulator